MEYSMTYSPFDISRAIGTNIGNAYKEHRQESALDTILAQASKTNDPNQFHDIMGQILKNVAPEKQQAALSIIESKIKGIKEKELEQKKLKDAKVGGYSAYAAPQVQAAQVRAKLGTGLPKKTQASQPIDPEQLGLIQKVRSQPGFNEMDELEQYQALTSAGVSKENASTESNLRSQQLERKDKAFDTSYKAQENFINEVTDSYKGFETEMKPRLLQMNSIPDDEIISPTSAVFLEQLGIPLGALEKPGSELYNKLSQDLLKGLPETYGSRILKVEVENFLKTIPTLMNSANGRRMIASNMLKLGELKEVYYKEMRNQQKDYLDNRKNLPKDFQQRVLDQVKPQIDKINEEFVKLSQITDVPEGTVPFFDPNGNIVFVPEDNVQWAIENQGKRIW